DGGRGGNIVLLVDRNMSTLMDFRYKRKYAAANGADGGGRNMSGRGAEDLIIKVPDGTVVYDRETGGIIQDMSGLDRFVLARGGNGGWGNQHFATPTRQTPRFANPGLPGQARDVTLELKLLADVGLVGFPNVGKSTLLQASTNARPKIADYHFTTLFPNLGLVYVSEGESFVLADIPGLIEGASDGVGLGHEFLRHVERCRLLIHVVDASGSEGRDPIADFETINAELQAYSPRLAAAPVVIAANKSDLFAEGEENVTAAFRKYIADKGLPLYEISAATGDGVRELIYAAARELRNLPPIQTFAPTYIEPDATPEGADTVEITRDGERWILGGAWIDRMLRGVNLDEHEQRMYFNRLLERSGVNTKLIEAGVSDGDTVVCGALEFEYKE
ncbi:MAG: GTPase ObgE, partial [Oscillospiraceae bacterium]|nr:GTPase ObgE [Oscillospiraceae bacterium]